MLSKVVEGDVSVYNEGFDGGGDDIVASGVGGRKQIEKLVAASGASSVAVDLGGLDKAVDLGGDDARPETTESRRMSRRDSDVFFVGGPVPEPEADYDICEIDYEADQMGDLDDVDYDDEKKNGGNGAGGVDKISTSDYQGPCQTLGTNFSRLGQGLSREFKDVRDEIEGAWRARRSKKCCTVDTLTKRVPAVKWLPKYRSVI
jgi:hypothetical protein